MVPAFMFFVAFSMSGSETTRNSALRARPEEHPRNAQFIKIHKNPRCGLSNILGFLGGDNVRP